MHVAVNASCKSKLLFLADTMVSPVNFVQALIAAGFVALSATSGLLLAQHFKLEPQAGALGPCQAWKVTIAHAD